MTIKKLAFAIFALSSTAIFAGGFSLYTESSPAAIANFAAGIGAEGRDAAVGYYNPATLVLIKRPEFVGGGVYVMPTANLSGSTTFSQTFSSGLGTKTLTEPFTNVDGGRPAIVPSFHVAIPGGEKVTLGLSVVSPLGLASNWPSDSPLRYQGTYTKLSTTELSPQIGGYVSNNIAIGLGTNFQWADVNYNTIIGAPASAQLPSGFGPPYATYYDTSSSNHGNSFGIGFHAGVLVKTDDNKSRFGVSYTYGVTQQFYGSSSLEGRLAGGLTSSYSRSPNLFSNPIKFPDILNFSLYQQVDNKTAMLGSIVYTMWSKYQQLVLYNVAVPGTNATNPVLSDVTTVYNYRNAIRASFGMNHDIAEQWQFRWGGGYDQAPTNPQYRDIRLPEADRLAIAAGLHWQTNQHLAWDLGYSYLFPLSSTEIHKTLYYNALEYDRIDASGHSYAQLVGLQVVITA